MIDFELVVPDGWVQIPTAPDTGTLRRRIIDNVIRHHIPDSLPRDKVGPWRRMLRKELTGATDEAARQSARSVLLPLQEFSGVKLPGSMLVTVLEGEDETEDPEQLLASSSPTRAPTGRTWRSAEPRRSAWPRSWTAAGSGARHRPGGSRTTCPIRTRPECGGC